MGCQPAPGDPAARGDPAGALDPWDEHQHLDLKLLLASRPGREYPFDLSREPERVRELHGRKEWGQGLSVARRLVEAGVRMVQVFRALGIDPGAEFHDSDGRPDRVYLGTPIPGLLG